MTYKGFDILLERQQCEFWTLNDDGETEDWAYDCHDSSHDSYFEYAAFIDDERVVGAADLDSLKAYLDKVVAEAESAV